MAMRIQKLMIGPACLILTLIFIASARADDLTLKPFPAPPPLDTPESRRIVVPNTLKVEPDTEEICGAARARGEPLSLGCAERQLKDGATRTPPVPNVQPLQAGSPDTKIGIANETAIKQQLGKNYGVDTKPFRPSRSFNAPFSNRR